MPVSGGGRKVSNNAGQGRLYIVATPIGNLSDIAPRALETLARVDLVAAEDTRHTRQLLAHHGIRARLVSLHEQNEVEQVPRLIGELQAGRRIALVSDAGTPLISDPGYRLVAAAAREGVDVRAVPGPSAVVAALSVSGLPTDRFAFEGFLPSRRGPRRQRLEAMRDEPRTLVFFESPRRLLATLADLVDAFGKDRPACVARELTKLHESIYRGSLASLRQEFSVSAAPIKGELVLCVGGNPGPPARAAPDVRRVLELLLAELPARRAARVAAAITGARANDLYRMTLDERREDAGPEGESP